MTTQPAKKAYERPAIVQRAPINEPLIGVKISAPT